MNKFPNLLQKARCLQPYTRFFKANLRADCFHITSVRFFRFLCFSFKNSNKPLNNIAIIQIWSRINSIHKIPICSRHMDLGHYLAFTALGSTSRLITTLPTTLHEMPLYESGTFSFFL